MSKNKPIAGSEEPAIALNLVDDAQLALDKAVRPPVWLTAILTGGVAAHLLSSFFLWPHHPLEWLLKISTMFVLVTIYLGFHFSLIRKGLKVRGMPTTTTGRWLMVAHVISVLFFGLLTGWAKNHGYSWSPWVYTAFVCGTLAFLMHCCPTCEPTFRTNHNEH